MRLCRNFPWRRETPAQAMATTEKIATPNMYRRFTSTREPRSEILNVTQTAGFPRANDSGKKYPDSSFALGPVASGRPFWFRGSTRIGIAHQSRQSFRDEAV